MHVFEMRAAVDEEAIRRLVHAFYARVQEDGQLGPIFAERIDADRWPAHLARMCDFWSTALLATGRYHGNPFEVHAALPGLTRELFAHWLSLFESTALEIFTPQVARSIMSRAHRMAGRLQQAAG